MKLRGFRLSVRGEKGWEGIIAPSQYAGVEHCNMTSFEQWCFQFVHYLSSQAVYA